MRTVLLKGTCLALRRCRQKASALRCWAVLSSERAQDREEREADCGKGTGARWRRTTLNRVEGSERGRRPSPGGDRLVQGR